jgi:hypothetical protein
MISESNAEEFHIVWLCNPVLYHIPQETKNAYEHQISLASNYLSAMTSAACFLNPNIRWTMLPPCCLVSELGTLGLCSHGSISKDGGDRGWPRLPLCPNSAGWEASMSFEWKTHGHLW